MYNLETKKKKKRLKKIKKEDKSLVIRIFKEDVFFGKYSVIN